MISDPVTHAGNGPCPSSRSRAALFRALVERGRELGCRRIDLDSGVRRHAARRFYPRERMDIDAHHFSRSLG